MTAKCNTECEVFGRVAACIMLVFGAICFASSICILYAGNSSSYYTAYKGRFYSTPEEVAVSVVIFGILYVILAFITHFATKPDEN